MPIRNRYKPGLWLVVCDVCARVKYNNECARGVSLKQRGRVVCSDCFDPRHPREDHIEVRSPSTKPTWPRTGDRLPQPDGVGLAGDHDE